jgi:hypothetical protein
MKTEVKAVISVMLAIAETIREMNEVPAGVLYASLLQHFPNLSASNFAQMTAQLKAAKLVEERHNLLRWIGPAF